MNTTESTTEIYEYLQSRFTKNRLQELSLKLIDAYKSKNHKQLRKYALVIFPDSKDIGESKLFVKLIKYVHPDRLNYLLKEIDRAHREGDVKKLSFYKTLVDSDQRIKMTFTFESNPDEEYVYSDDDFGFSTTVNFDDNYDYEDQIDEYEDSNDFISALKAELLGNMDYHLSPGDLFSLEGELDLSDCGIQDLTGLEYCKNISRLNLSGNDISNIYDIKGLEFLRELFLAGNSLTDIDHLAGMALLEVLDLSNNEIDDISPLLTLSNLQFLDIRNNEITDTSVIEELEKQGVVVIC